MDFIERFRRSACLCRARDLGQLVILSELVRALSELIHALQKERGASSIFLGSGGKQFAVRLDVRVRDCQALEHKVRERLEQVDDDALDGMRFGARFYGRIAMALTALDTLSTLRTPIRSLQIAPQDSVRAFTDIIGALLAVGYEIGDIAADPQISRALIALINLSQAKEYAGQERATVGAAVSSGQFRAADLERLRYLVTAQKQTFAIFADFAAEDLVDALNETLGSSAAAAVERMRGMAMDAGPGKPTGLFADAWYEHATSRIDGLRMIEERMSAELGRLCALKLGEASRGSTGLELPPADATAPVAVVFGGVGGESALYGLDPGAPGPLRSILDVVEDQSRRISDVSAQLESARAALVERKLIDRAKGVLMDSRGISEKAAYGLLRDTAMKQNKRIVQVAEAIVSTAEILKA